MPELGEIKRGREIGQIGSNGYCKFAWAVCEMCGKERWVHLHKNKLLSKHCRACAGKIRGRRQRGEKHPNWKGGRVAGGQGYIKVKLQLDDFFYPMVESRGYVQEHRLVMAKHMSRCLLPWEIVHHRNGVKDDNRVENLELIGCKGKHNTMLNKQIKQQAKLIKQLKEKIILLEKEIRSTRPYQPARKVDTELTAIANRVVNTRKGNKSQATGRDNNIKEVGEQV